MMAQRVGGPASVGCAAARHAGDRRTDRGPCYDRRDQKVVETYAAAPRATSTA